MGISEGNRFLHGSTGSVKGGTGRYIIGIGPEQGGTRYKCDKLSENV